MGKRSATETLASLLVALLEERRLRQSDLAARAGVDGETVARVLRELQDSGVPLERTMEGRAVVWSVPDAWFPNGVLFEGEAAHALLRLLLRLRPSRARDEALAKLTHAASSARKVRAAQAAILPAGDAGGEEWLSALEDSAIGRFAVRVRYQGSKDTDARWRVWSVQRVVHEARPWLLAWCHESLEVKHFRPDRVSALLRAEDVAFREAPEALLERQQQESIHGYRGGTLQEVCFVVHDEAWSWVKDNLPFDVARTERVAGGTRVVVRTKGGEVLVRYLLGLADRLAIETVQVRQEVAEMARRALAAHG